MFTFCTESFSDLHKDAYGFRPRDHFFYSPECTDDERQQMWDNAVEWIRFENEAQKPYSAEAITVAMEMGVSEETATRWLEEAFPEEIW